MLALVMCDHERRQISCGRLKRRDCECRSLNNTILHQISENPISVAALTRGHRKATANVQPLQTRSSSRDRNAPYLLGYFSIMVW